jgi:hypothetical protein
MLHNIYVASICFKRFIRMLQVFHLDVAKVDLDVAYVFAMDFKCFQVFQTYVASVSAISNECCKCFHLDIAKVDRNVAHVAMGLTCYKRLPPLLGRHRGSPCGDLGSAEASASGVGDWDPRGFPACGSNSHLTKKSERDGRGRKQRGGPRDGARENRWARPLLRARQRLDASAPGGHPGASKSDCQYNCTSISEKHNYSIIRNEFLCF